MDSCDLQCHDCTFAFTRMRGGVTRQEWSGIVAFFHFFIKLELHIVCKGQVQTVVLKEVIGRLLTAVKE